MAHTFTNLLYHIVFSTKERIPFLQKEIRPPMFDYFGGTVRGLGGTCLEVGGIEDHIHSLVRLKPNDDVADFLAHLKPTMTKWGRQNIDRRFSWQPGYGAFSVGESQVTSVRNYIRNQEAHHGRVSFKDEFQRMLVEAGIEFDPNRLWG